MIKSDNNEDEVLLEHDEDADVEFEEFGATEKDKLKKLKEELKQTQKKAAEHMDGWQRALADYANLKKDSGEQVKELKGYVLEGFIEELLPVLDSFDMAMKNKETWESVNENWRKGIEYIYIQLTSILANNQIEVIGKVGEKFNPDIHTAVEEIATDDTSKDHSVSEVIQKGYKGAKSVIRPAKVKIFITK